MTLPFWPRRRLGGSLAVALLLGLSLPIAAEESTDFVARLSPAAAAMEYWDITARLASGHRFFARFLVTNEGPGTRTAVAVGHLILPSGEVKPIKYGRLREKWSISDDGRRLKIASAVLDVSRPVTHVEVDSDKYGIKIHLDLERNIAPATIELIPGRYRSEVLPPLPVRASLWLRGMAAPLTGAGTLALTHTWMEESEFELLHQRVELIGRAGDADLYLTEITGVDGSRQAAVVLRRGGRFVRPDDGATAPPLTVTLAAPQSAPGDARYPVPQQWHARDAAGLHIAARLQREWLRWDPLEIIPQPFRFLLSMQGQPQRVWADADVELTLPGGGSTPAAAASGSGIGTVSFARPARAR